MIRKTIIAVLLLLTLGTIAVWVESFRLKRPLIWDGEGEIVLGDFWICLGREAESDADLERFDMTTWDRATFEKYRAGSGIQIGSLNDSWRLECENQKGDLHLTLDSFTPTYVDGPDGGILGFSYSSGTHHSSVWLKTLPDGTLIGGGIYTRRLVAPFWAIVLLFMTYPIIAFIRGPLRRRRRRKRGLCPACGYNLTGNTSGVCRECAAKVEGS